MKNKTKMIIAGSIFAITAIIGIICTIFVLLPLKKIEAQAATCESEGNDVYYVNIFGVCFENEAGTKAHDKSIFIKPKKEHELAVVAEKASTCTTEGNIACFSCNSCGRYFSDKNGKFEIAYANVIIPKLKHDFEEKAEGAYLKSDATCTAKAEYYKSCSVCGIISDTETFECGELLDHDIQIHEAHEATCISVGWDTYESCSRCDYSTYNEISAIGHTYWFSERYWEVSGYVMPSTDRFAKIPYSCSVCHQNFVAEWDEDIFSFTDSNNVRIEDRHYAGTIIMFDDASGLLCLNLSAASESTVFQELQNVGYYNSSTRKLTIPTGYSLAIVKAVKIIGRTTLMSNFAIDTQTFTSLILSLQNLRYTAPSGTVGLNLKNVQTVTLEIIGAVSITGGESANGVSANDMTVKGEYSLIVKGGNGKAGEVNLMPPNQVIRWNGDSGGTGILATDISIDVIGTVEISGGSGGAAYNRDIGDNDGDGSDGRNGFAGGAGGGGVNAKQMILVSGKVNIVGGDGGRGGNASECNIGGPYTGDVRGGRGGDGGNGADAIESDIFELIGGTLFAIGGNGGDTGKRGGCHKDEHSAWNQKATDGSVGVAGCGGNGISSSCVIMGDKAKIIKAEAGEHGSVNDALNQC